MATAALAPAIDAPILNRLAQRIGARKVELWFNGSASLRLDRESHPAVLTVQVANRFVAKRFDAHVLDTLRLAAQEELGESVQIDVRVASAPASSSSSAPADPVALPQEPTARKSRVQKPAGTPHPLANTGLVHRLEDFVAGPCNALAYKACEQLADALAGTPTDPARIAGTTPTGGTVFLHGGCGLGKTHLLQGTVRRLLQRRPGAKVLYFTGEQFTNAFITAIRNRTLDRFRKQMRELDLLALDDVQFLSDKQGTQTEFLHCFDAIAQSGAAILLASDEHPRRLARFSAPLVSRFGHGLVIQIDPPDPVTRRTLLEAFAARRGLILSAGATEALLPHAGPSVREALGLLAKLQALGWYEQQRAGKDTPAGVGLSVGLALVQRLLDTERSHQPTRTATFDDILRTVTEALEVDAAHVADGSRKRQAVLARELVVRLARDLRKMSYPEIALAMGRHGHSTVLNADKRLDDKLDHEPPCPVPGCDRPRTIREVYQQLHRRLTGA